MCSDDRLLFIKKITSIVNFSNCPYFWYSYIIMNFVIIGGQIILLFTVGKDINLIMGISSILATQIQFVCKCLCIYYFSKELEDMHGLIKTYFWDFDIFGKEIEKNLQGRAKLATTFVIVQLVVSTFALLVYATFPLTKYPPGMRTLPILIWFPFDVNPSPLFEVIYALLSINGIIYILAIVISDFIFLYFAQHLLAQFILLKHFLENITANIIQEKSNDILYKIYSDDYQKKLYQRLCVAIDHHNKLLRFGKDLEIYTSITSTFQLLLNFSAFTVIGYILITDHEDLAKSFKLLIYLIGLSVQLKLYAIHGSELQEKSSEVATAAYLCEWYLGNASFRRGLTILQMNAQKTIKLSAVGCVDINNNTMILVYRSAFSLITLLRSINALEDFNTIN